MKSISIKILALCSLAFALTMSGCKKDKENESETLMSNIAKPNWTAPAKYDYNSSMTAIVRISFDEQYPELAVDYQLNENDLLAAFIDGTCVGVATPDTEKGLFFLYITGLDSDSGMVTLKYYSTHYKNLFAAKFAFEFQNNAMLGTVAEPYVPGFVVEK